MSARGPLFVLVSALLTLAVACGSGRSPALSPASGTSTTVLAERGEPAGTQTDVTGPADQTRLPASGGQGPGELAGAAETSTTEAPADATTTGRDPGGDSRRRACPSPSSAPTSPVPAPLAAVLTTALADPLFADTVLGASVWVEGYGEVMAQEADQPLVIASNQKLLTALGVLSTLPGTATFATEIVGTGPVLDGMVQGDLVLVGGGDPTLLTFGPHSFATLVEQLLDAGIKGATGGLVADESRYPVQRNAPGWPAWYMPDYVGPMSPLMVEDNRHRWDDAYLADPALGNAELFRIVLESAGITLGGPTRGGAAPRQSVALASLPSPTVDELVGLMLVDSDNEVAELLTREAGLAADGDGSIEAGTAVLAAALDDELCLDFREGWADGSGLSWSDLRSARELRSLLQVAARTAAWPVVHAGLPLAGVTGTLANRFIGTAAEGNLRAKTGYLQDVRSLAGTMTTAGGRQVAFALVVNGPGAYASVDAMDALVAAIAADVS